MKNSYESDVEIDEGALDVEWLDHPSRMYRYCVSAADAQMRSDLAKERQEIVKAEVEQSVRSDPASHGIEVRTTKDGARQPPTEGAINAAVLLHDGYQEATRAYIHAKFENAVAQGAVRAFDARRSALENLVRLHGQSYFAGPSVPHDLSDMRGQREARRRERDASAQKVVHTRRMTRGS